MGVTIEGIEKLYDDLYVWFNGNGFLRGLVWQTVDERRHDEHAKVNQHYFIKLIYEDSEFCNIMSGLPTAEPNHSKWLKLFEEFDAILEKHGFWFERINDWSLSIYSRDGDGSDE